MSNQRDPDAVFDAIGDPMRRRVLEVLRAGELPVGDLAARLPIGRPAVSKHLRVLQGAGLVRHRSEGTRNLYAVAPEGIAEAQRWLVGLWDEALGAFADHVEARVREQGEPSEGPPEKED
jgi:DNA-binding transcriptional ArsR family regulator